MARTRNTTAKSITDKARLLKQAEKRFNRELNAYLKKIAIYSTGSVFTNFDKLYAPSPSDVAEAIEETGSSYIATGSPLIAAYFERLLANPTRNRKKLIAAYTYFGGGKTFTRKDRVSSIAKAVSTHVREKIIPQWTAASMESGQVVLEHFDKRYRQVEEAGRFKTLAKLHPTKEQPNLRHARSKIPFNIISAVGAAPGFELLKPSMGGEALKYSAGEPITPSVLMFDEDSRRLLDIKNALFRFLKKQVKNLGSVKIEIEAWYASFNEDEARQKELDEKFTAQRKVSLKAIRLMGSSFEQDFEGFWELFFRDVLHPPEEYKTPKDILSNLYLTIYKHRPLKGGHAKHPIPKELAGKKALICMQNDDDECHKWCLLRERYPKPTNRGRCGDLKAIITASKCDPEVKVPNYEGLEFPLRVCDMAKFEEKNPEWPVCVYSYDVYDTMDTEEADEEADEESDGVVPKDLGFDCLYISRIDPTRATKLLLIDEHYYLITNMSALMSSSLTKHNGKIHFCYCCLMKFYDEKSLGDHMKFCLTRDRSKPYVHMRMPKVEHKEVYGRFGTVYHVEIDHRVIKFKHAARTMRHPVVIYYDFESLLAKNQDVRDCNGAKRDFHTVHVMSCYSIYVVSQNDAKVKSRVITYAGPAAGAEFIRVMRELSAEITKVLKASSKIEYVKNGSSIKLPDGTRKQMVRDELLKKFVWTNPETFETVIYVFEEDLPYYDSPICCLCKDLISVKTALHHIHFTDEIIGMACRNCNLQARKMTHIPAICHNSKGYDNHHIIRALIAQGELNDDLDISVIPMSREKYMTMKWCNFQFIDSFQHLLAGLDTLVRNQAEQGLEKFPHLKKIYGEKLAGVLHEHKLDYAYTYYDCFEKFSETEQPPESFFNNPGGRERATEIQKMVGLKTLKQYTEFYCEIDVIQLADVFEEYRTLALQTYGLDPALYFGASNMTWPAMLKQKDPKHVLMSLDDASHYEYCEGAMRGGLSQITHAHAKANNKYMDDFDMGKNSVYLSYEDMNNEYGKAMTYPMPVREYKWVEDISEWSMEKILEQKKSQDVGFIFEVDIYLPECEHDKVVGFPLLPEHKAVDPEQLSEKQLIYTAQGALGEAKLVKLSHEDMLQEGLKNTSKIEKLIADLHPKKNYRIHYLMLKFALQLGYKVTKFHRALQFIQEPVLKAYVEFNTEKRKNAKSEAQKDLLKNMNCSLFGKTCMNVRKQRQMEIVRKQKRFHKIVNDVRFSGGEVWNSKTMLLEREKSAINCSHPIAIGQAVLDISKLLLYKYYYKVLRPIYGNRVKVMGMDTDSLFLRIEYEDAGKPLNQRADYYADMISRKEHYDLSGMPNVLINGKQLHDDTNKKVLGKMKFESNVKTAETIKDVLPIEFCGVRSKCYSFLYANQLPAKAVCKGIPKNIKKSKLKHEMYRECVLNGARFAETFDSFMSKNHIMYTVRQTKKALNPLNDKVHMLDDGSTLPFGHKDIQAVRVKRKRDENAPERPKKVRKVLCARRFAGAAPSEPGEIEVTDEDMAFAESTIAFCRSLVIQSGVEGRESPRIQIIAGDEYVYDGTFILHKGRGEFTREDGKLVREYVDTLFEDTMADNLDGYVAIIESEQWSNPVMQEYLLIVKSLINEIALIESYEQQEIELVHKRMERWEKAAKRREKIIEENTEQAEEPCNEKRLKNKLKELDFTGTIKTSCEITGIPPPTEQFPTYSHGYLYLKKLYDTLMDREYVVSEDYEFYPIIRFACVNLADKILPMQKKMLVLSMENSE